MSTSSEERAALELPWEQGTGSYNDTCRIVSTVERKHPQSRELGVALFVKSRIAYVVETTSGQGAKTAAFVVQAANMHHDLVQALRDIAEYGRHSTIQPVDIARQVLEKYGVAWMSARIPAVRGDL